MSLCRVFGTITNLDGTPNTDVEVKAEIEPTDDDFGGQLLAGVGVTGKFIEVFTDDDGKFEMNLLRGARVRLHIPEIRLRKIINVPELDAADFATLI